jgi:bifunctional non-homologous end joining protein LigD
MPRKQPLTEYRRKRNFAKTSEPAGGTKRRQTKRLRFVVQKHDARNLHFDFRLELDGVMKSWAVPKGPSYDPKVRRLAMQVEDHPIEYNAFEGTIPEGEYGAGTVMLWDRGTYEPEEGGGEAAVREGLKRGDLKILVHGKRLKGGWVLVRTRRDARGRAQWLLIKHRDEVATDDYDVVADVTTSVASGRTMDEIAERRVNARRTAAVASRRKRPTPRRRRSTQSTS